MASQSPKITPPFAWLGPYTPGLALIGVVALGALFRFLHLASVPPGLYYNPALIGLQALDLINHGHWPTLSVATDYAPLWIVLQSLPVKLAGSTLLALRWWPALLGTAAVATSWLWVREVWGLRIAWISSLFMAVTPWAVTLTRDGSATALIPFLTTLTLWLATIARRRPSLATHLALALTLTLDFLAGPLGWLIAAMVLILGFYILLRHHDLKLATKPRLIGATILAIGLGACAYLAARSLDSLKHLPSAIGLTANPATLGANLVKTITMFNLTGDQNWRHNLAGEPLLNVFVGLMLVAGVLVGISRLHERRYRLLFVFTIVTLIPVVMSTVETPNAARAAAAMPFIFALAAIGTSYLLELWYATFPINSAARSAGQAAVIILLGLTVFQGYTQYFRAWAASAQIYTAYDEDAVAIARNLATTSFNGRLYIIAPADQLPVIAYLAAGHTPYATITPAAIASLPQDALAREFLIATPLRDPATTALKAKFPGHILQPEYSTFNQAQIYYEYSTVR